MPSFKPGDVVRIVRGNRADQSTDRIVAQIQDSLPANSDWVYLHEKGTTPEMASRIKQGELPEGGQVGFYIEKAENLEHSTGSEWGEYVPIKIHTPRFEQR